MQPALLVYYGRSVQTVAICKWLHLFIWRGAYGGSRYLLQNQMGRCLLLLQLCILQCEKPRQPLLLLLAANAFVVASTAACHYHCYYCCYYYYYYSCSCCYGHYCWLSLQVLLLPLLLLLLLLPLLLLLVLLPVRLRRRTITVATWHKQKTSVSFACAQSCRQQCTSQYALIATVHTSIIA
jgi:hypothetical protein